MKLIYFFMRYSRRYLMFAVLAGVISGASSTGLLAIINASLRGRGSSTLLLAFVALCAIVPLSRIISEVLLAYLGQGALFDLRIRLSQQILGVPLRRLEEIGAHRLLTALTDDIPSVTGIVTLIPLLCINAAIVIGCLIYLGWLSWVMLLCVLFFMAIGIASYQIPIVKAMRYFKLSRKDGDDLFNHFRALTEGIKELKLHYSRRRAFVSDVLQETATNFRKHNLYGLSIYTAASSWGQLLVFIVIGLMIFAAPARINISVESLTGYTLALLFIMTPLQVIMNSAPNLSRANIALNNVEELGLTLATNSSEDELGRPSPANPTWNSLELAGVTHTYQREGEENHFTLGPINLAFSRGEIIFLTGGNGSGKTTLAKLLVGLYIPEAGEIRLDGSAVTNENREAYRQLFSVVFSDFYLFERFLGLDALELDSRAQDYLAQLQLSHKVEVKHGRLSTTDLSQGQRKRLALLTAYLEDRPIYLFDEWAADQDPLFKEVFYYHLLPDLKANGKTIFVISHDDRYYRVGDRVIKLDYGNVVSEKPTASSADESDQIAIAAK
jgi:putative pyoverdin transport system ATP-binding/permease protein